MAVKDETSIEHIIETLGDLNVSGTVGSDSYESEPISSSLPTALIPETSSSSSVASTSGVYSDDDGLLQSSQSSQYEKKYDQIRKLIDENKNILLYGPGGTGKTYMLTQYIYQYAARKGIRVDCTATTGIAALGLNNPDTKTTGRTFHGWAGIGLAQHTAERLFQSVRSNRHAKSRWQYAQLLIIEEISMYGGSLLSKVDYIARRIRALKNPVNLTKPFGGIQVILCGDFLQLPPVKDEWIFQTVEWENLKLYPVVFQEPKRYPDIEFYGLLYRIRSGEHTEEDIELLRSRASAYRQLIKILSTRDTTNVIKPTMLYPLKKDVEVENLLELDRLTTPCYTFEARDDIRLLNKDASIEKYELMLDTTPKVVKLKVGAQVMLKTNLDVSAGLVNGSRGVVTEITAYEDYNEKHMLNTEKVNITDIDYVVNVRFINGQRCALIRQTWEIHDEDCIARRTQIPLVLAWSLSIHKVQGVTLDYAAIDMANCFEYGQVYVALSRIRQLKGLFLKSFAASKITSSKHAIAYSKHIEDCYFENKPLN